MAAIAEAVSILNNRNSNYLQYLNQTTGASTAATAASSAPLYATWTHHMNFDQLIYPLTEFLTDYNFSVTKKEQHFIEYSSNTAVITVAYANLEYLFYTHIGQDSKSLVELTPIVVTEVFKDDRFRLQSTLTIENLISFFKTTGNHILSGDKEIFYNLHKYSEHKSREYTKQIIHLQNIQGADEAWKQKDYISFIKCIDKAEKDLISETYLKKYRVAVDKLQRRTG